MLLTTMLTTDFKPQADIEALRKQIGKYRMAKSGSNCFVNLVSRQSVLLYKIIVRRHIDIYDLYQLFMILAAFDVLVTAFCR